MDSQALNIHRTEKVSVSSFAGSDRKLHNATFRRNWRLWSPTLASLTRFCFSETLNRESFVILWQGRFLRFFPFFLNRKKRFRLSFSQWQTFFEHVTINNGTCDVCLTRWTCYLNEKQNFVLVWWCMDSCYLRVKMCNLFGLQINRSTCFIKCSFVIKEEYIFND